MFMNPSRVVNHCGKTFHNLVGLGSPGDNCKHDHRKRLVIIKGMKILRLADHGGSNEAEEGGIRF